MRQDYDSLLSLALGGVLALAILWIVAGCADDAPLAEPPTLTRTGSVLLSLDAGEPHPFEVAPSRPDVGAVQVVAKPLDLLGDPSCLSGVVVALSVGDEETISSPAGCSSLVLDWEPGERRGGTVTAREDIDLLLEMVVLP